MPFCALTVDQHKSLYKLIYKNILDSQTFDLTQFSTDLYNKVFGATKNHDLALTYTSYIPSYAANLQTEDKEVRTIFKAAKVDANELLDKIDEWENNLPNVESYIGVSTPVSATTESPVETVTTATAQDIVDDSLRRASNREQIKEIMEDTFSLPESQAVAVASIYDKVNQAYQNRTGRSLYGDIAFRKSTLADLGQDAQFQIIGEKGAANFQKESLDKLSTANQLETEGKSSAQIFTETGWERGVDGKWRVDLPTDNFKLKGNSIDILENLKNADTQNFSVPLSEIISYPELFIAYPQLQNLSVQIEEEAQTKGAINFAPEDGNNVRVVLTLNTELTSDESLLDTLSHEIQHAIQLLEGFPALSDRGLRVTEETYERYRASANEVEARNATRRRGIADEEKEFVPVSVSEDVLREKQIAVDMTFPKQYNLLFQKNETIARAAVQIAADGKAIIHALTDPNVSSPLHELAHVWERQLTDVERRIVLEWTGQYDENKTDSEVWNTATSESFARGFERYLYEGYSPNIGLSEIFQNFKTWLKNIYKGIFGTEIDLELNDNMRNVYATMLGGNYRQIVLDELTQELETVTTASKLTEKYKAETTLAKDMLTPIPPDSTNYWSHLSTIQKAFINNEYDQLIREGKVDEARLREIVASTRSLENAGLGMDLVDQAMFRNTRQDLIEDRNYWVTFPSRESQEFDSYARTVREIIANGSLLDAINNNIISTEDASRVLTHSGQIGIKEERAIKAKIKENEAVSEQTDVIQDNLDKERASNPDIAVGVTQKDLDITKIRSIAKELPKSIYSSALANTTTDAEFFEVMQSIAEQANDPGTYDATVKMVGEYIVGVSQDMFPDSIVEGGDLMDYIKDNPLSREELNAMDNVEEFDTPIAEGDTVSLKGDNFTVVSIIYGETADDHMYELSNGSMKFGFQIQRVRSFDEQVVENYNNTSPEIFRLLETEDGVQGELTEEDINPLSYVGLKALIERLNSKFNNVIKYKIVSSSEDFMGRFVNGEVVINLRKYDKTTPFHEYLHPFIEVLKKDNKPLYDSLRSELASLPEAATMLKEVVDTPIYKNSSREDIEDEVLVRYLAKKASENVNSAGRRIEKKYKSALERLVEKFRSWFSTLWREGKSIIENRNDKSNRKFKKGLADIPLTATLEDVVDIISLSDIVIDLSERLETIKAIDKFQANASAPVGEETYEQKMLKKIKQKLAVLESTARERIGSDELLGEVIKLRSILKNPDEIFSLYSYMQQGFHALNQASTNFNSITNKLFAAKGNLSKEDLLEFSKQLEVIKNLVSFYTEAIDYFTYSKKEMDNEEFRVYSEIINKQERILAHLKDRSADITTEWLFPYVERQNAKIKDKYPDYVLTKEKFKASLYAADNDIDQAFLLLGSVSSSKDAFSAVMRSALYELVETNHLYEAVLINSTKLAYADFLKKTGLENGRKETIEYYKNNYLRKASIRVETGRDADNNPIFEYKEHWAFTQKYNYDLFDKDRTAFMEDVNVFSPSGFDDTNTTHIRTLINWENANGILETIGTEKQVRDILDANGKKTGEEWVDVPVTKLTPNNNYINLEYTRLENDPFYQKLLKDYNEGNEKLGENRLQYGIVPQISKGGGLFVDYKNKTALQKVKLIGNKALELFVAPKGEETNNSGILENLDGSKNYAIKGYHNMLLEESDLDLSLPETVVKFAGNANLNSLKSELNPLVKTAKSLLEDNPRLKQEARRIVQTRATPDEKGNRTMFDRVFRRPASIEKARTRLNEQLVEFINDAMYGENSIQQNVNVFGRSVNLNKLGNNWAFLTALNNMAFNINGAVGNLLIGKANNFIEATGGRYFSKSDFKKANGQYISNFKNFMQDGFRLEKSKVTQLGVKYDAIQGEFRDKFGKRFVGNLTDRYANGDTLFILNHAAEHEIQITGLLALMNATKVKLKTGEEISLFDAHSVDAKGLLKIRDDVEWTKEDDLDFINRWHAINKRLNGNYSSFDKSTMQRRWYGQLALIYRKFIYTSIRNRFTKEYNDYEIGNIDYGYQRKFFTKLYSDIKDYKFQAATRLWTKKGWNEDEKQAFNKSVAELSFLAGSFILAGVIAMGEAGDKDDTKWGKKQLLLYVTRFNADMQMFTLLGAKDVVRILQNPSAIMMTMTKYADFFAQLASPTETYDKKTGMFEKGESKLKAKMMKALPIVRQITNFLSPEEQLAYYNVLRDKK